MSVPRRRSGSWMKELIHPPRRIDVVPLHNLSETNLDTDSNTLDIGGDLPKLSAHDSRSDIDLEEHILQDLDQIKEHTGGKHYLEHYFEFLHCVGLASFRKYWKTFSASYAAHQILFWLFSTLAISDAVKMIKLCSILYGKRGDLYRYVIIGRYFLYGTKRIYFVKLVSSCSKYIFRLFEDVRKTSKIWRNKPSKVYAYAVGFASLAAALISAVFGWVTISRGWSPLEFIWDQSFDMILSVFVWTTNTTIFDEQYETLRESFLVGSTFTPMTLSFGVIGIIMEFFGALLDYIVIDVMFFSALTMYSLTRQFQFQMMQKDCNVDNILKQYKHLQRVCNSIEEAFGGLFKISHASNLFSCAYFLLILVSGRDFHVGAILLVVRILKVGVTCYFSTRAASINKLFRRWVHSKIIESDEMNVDMKLKATAMLNESIESPLGLGSDTFFIDEIFILKFATMVGTFSLFLIDKKRKSELGED